MTISYYNAQFMKTAPKIYICKSNTKRETVGHVKDYFNASLNIKFSALNTFTFSIPAEMYINNKLQKNPLVDTIRERYLVRLELNGAFEYFVIMKIQKIMEQDGFETITYQCYSMGIQIANTIVRDYKETLNLTKHAQMMLAESNWTVDYVEADFDLYDKEYEMASGNSLQCIFELCERFNAAVVFNTDKKTINFHYPKNVGKNKGLRLKKGKYLENFNIDIDAEAMVTRLYPYGADGLDIRRLNSTGSDYIEDYSFYLYPFQHDENWNVIRKSKHMPDDLCIAILKYQKKLEGLKGQFDTLVTQATAKREEIQKADQQMSVYKASEADLLNQRDVINATYQDNAPSTPQWQDIINRLTNVQNQIVSQQSILDSLNAQLKDINTSLEALHKQVDVTNPVNFTSAQLAEWKNFQHSKEYFNDSIVDDEDLMKEALIVFEEFKQPPVSLNLSMEDFTKHVDFNLDHDKLNIGDLLTLTSQNLNVNVTAKMTEIIINFEASTVNVTVANVESYNDDFDKFIASLGLSVSTSTQVSRDKWNWDKGREAYDDVTELLENAFDSAKQLITGGLNGSVTLSERGLVSVDLREKSTWLMITNGQLFITPDNGNTVSVAISKNGVHAERLVGRIILGNKLWIEDSIGVVSIQSGTVSIYDDKKQLRVHLGRYPNPDAANQYKYGLRIYNGAFDIRTAEGRSGMQMDEKGIRAFNTNGVTTFEVIARTGEVKIAGSLSIKTHPDSNRGVVIDGDGIRGYNSSGGIVFQIDNYGNAWFAGRLQWATGTVDNLDGSFKGTLNFADGNFTGTLRGVDGEFTGTLRFVDGSFTGTLEGATGRFNGVLAGTIDAQTMRTIQLDASQITTGGLKADRIDVNELSAISSNLGNITSGNIDIDEDLYVGRNIYLGRKWGGDLKNVIFSGTTRVSGDWSRLIASASQVKLEGSDVIIEAYRTVIYGILDLSNAQVVGFRP